MRAQILSCQTVSERDSQILSGFLRSGREVGTVYMGAPRLHSIGDSLVEWGVFTKEKWGLHDSTDSTVIRFVESEHLTPINIGWNCSTPRLHDSTILKYRANSVESLTPLIVATASQADNPESSDLRRAVRSLRLELKKSHMTGDLR